MMPRVIVTTDDGREVWSNDLEAADIWNIRCAMNARGSAIASGLRRAVVDAEAIQEGRDPERPSERAMRRAAPDFDPRVDYPERFREGPI